MKDLLGSRHRVGEIVNLFAGRGDGAEVTTYLHRFLEDYEGSIPSS